MQKIQYLLVVVLIIVVVALAVAIAVVKPDSGSSSEGTSTEAPGGNTDVLQYSGKPSQTEAVPDSTESPTAEPTPDTQKPLKGLVICIDAGHQGQQNKEKEPCAPWGKDANSSVNNEVMKTKCASGTTGKFTGVPEFEVTLDISLKMQTELEKLGATVVMIRETHDVNLSNKERAEIGNNAKADVVLRVHCNGAESESAQGIELFVRDKGDNTAEYKARSDSDFALASELLGYLVDKTNAKNRGVKKSDSYTGTNWSEVPSIIIECGFMSNEEEDNLLVSAEYQQKIADAVANWCVNSKLLNK